MTHLLLILLLSNAAPCYAAEAKPSPSIFDLSGLYETFPKAKVKAILAKLPEKKMTEDFAKLYRGSAGADGLKVTVKDFNLSREGLENGELADMKLLGKGPDGGLGNWALTAFIDSKGEAHILFDSGLFDIDECGATQFEVKNEGALQFSSSSLALVKVIRSVSACCGASDLSQERLLFFNLSDGLKKVGDFQTALAFKANDSCATSNAPRAFKDTLEYDLSEFRKKKADLLPWKRTPGSKTGSFTWDALHKSIRIQGEAIPAFSDSHSMFGWELSPVQTARWEYQVRSRFSESKSSLSLPNRKALRRWISQLLPGEEVVLSQTVEKKTRDSLIHEFAGRNIVFDDFGKSHR